MAKITQYPVDSAPTDDDKVILVDVGSGQNKQATRDDFLTGNPIIDPTIKGSASGEQFTGKHTGWIDPLLTFSVSSGYNKGNKEADLTASADPSGTISPGMKMMFSRNTSPPTQCADFESSSSHYAVDTTVSGISFTDDYTGEFWIKMESYASGGVISRYNGTSGFIIYVNSSGQVQIQGNNGGAGNYRFVSSYQSLPLNRWVHVAATLDMSASSGSIYFDGVSVPTSFTSAGTNPTALVQAGNLEIGSYNATNFLDAKLADVRLWDTARTATQIKDNMNQQLVGNETNLVGYWKLDGNFNDSDSNANNLTAQNSVTATSTDNPMKATEYAKVVKVTTTTVTVFTGTDHNIPNMTLNTPRYSIHDSPFNFPGKDKWFVQYINKVNASTASPTQNQWYNLASAQILIPTGAWDVTPVTNILTENGASQAVVHGTLSTASNSESDPEFTVETNANAVTVIGATMGRSKYLNLTSATTYYYNTRSATSGAGSIYNANSNAPQIIRVDCAY